MAFSISLFIMSILLSIFFNILIMGIVKSLSANPNIWITSFLFLLIILSLYYWSPFLPDCISRIFFIICFIVWLLYCRGSGFCLHPLKGVTFCFCRQLNYQKITLIICRLYFYGGHVLFDSFLWPQLKGWDIYKDIPFKLSCNSSVSVVLCNIWDLLSPASQDLLSFLELSSVHV